MSQTSTKNNKPLKLVLLLLIFLFLGLLYAYRLIAKPPIEIEATVRLRPMFGIYGFGRQPETFLRRPSDVAFDSAGRIYIADTGNSRILVFDGRGRFVREIGGRIDGFQQLHTPMGVTVDEQGIVYVADQELDKRIGFGFGGGVGEEG